MKVWSMFIVEYYAATENKEILPSASNSTGKPEHI
jgi:hypothetical protein